MTLGAMELIDRVRAQLPTAVEKRMFGGTGFMVDGALACSVSARGLLVRVGAEHQADLLADAGVEPMVKGGRTSRGWVQVQPHVVAEDAALREWLERGVAAARASVSPQR
jgi:TfoX/Sxy family transcriptional regulator of competence genes